MKIFWCWQSDTDGRTGRHFIRDALTDAIAALKEAEDVEEPVERELHLDHGRQGVSGSPELARTIFAKIKKAAIFVADVTVVGETPPRADDEGKIVRKKLINPNVAIEYGYAVQAVGDELILLVQNTAHGGREGLPFDLAHKAGPIQFKLSPGASNKEIATKKAELTGVLTKALRECLATIANAAPPPAETKFVETPSTANRGLYWMPGEVLARSEGVTTAEAVDYRYEGQRGLYVRLIPIKPLPEPLPLRVCLESVHQRASLRSNRIAEAA